MSCFVSRLFTQPEEIFLGTGLLLIPRRGDSVAGSPIGFALCQEAGRRKEMNQSPNGKCPSLALPPLSRVAPAGPGCLGPSIALWPAFRAQRDGNRCYDSCLILSGSSVKGRLVSKGFQGFSSGSRQNHRGRRPEATWRGPRCSQGPRASCLRLCRDVSLVQ